MLPTMNVLQRTFLIRQGNQTGTAFAVELEGREYLVTAKHVVPDRSTSPMIVHAETWKSSQCTGIYHHPGNPDVAIITLSKQIAPRLHVELSAGGISPGEGMIILGFPFGWNHTQYDINNGYPLPFVKSAILSAIIPLGETYIIYLDGHSNPGFSGGPVVAQGESQQGQKIIGVVTQSNNESTPHPSQFNPPLKQLGGYPVPDDHVHPTNSGFILAHNIQHAIEVIEAYPYGAKMAP